MKSVSVLIVGLSLALVGTAAAQDSLNCRFEGNWPFGPSFAVALDSARNLAFLGSGGGVYVLDVTDPSNPVKLSEAIHTRQTILGLAFEANRLYVADSMAGLCIWDVSTPASPALLGAFSPPPGSAYSAKGVAISGDYAYVADFDSALSIILVSDPHAPAEVGRWRAPDNAFGVAVAGNHAYLADNGGGLRVIDISNPQSPSEVGRCSTSNRAVGVAVRGNYAYVADFDSLIVIDISTPSNPQETGGCLSVQGNVRAVALAGPYAYVGGFSSPNGGLGAINVSDPARPREVGFIFPNPDVTCLASAVAVAGSCAYLASSNMGLTLVDITKSESLRVLGTKNIPGPAISVAVAGNYAYFGEGWYPPGLTVLDISNPQDAREVGYLGLSSVVSPGPSEIAVVGNRVYLADPGFGLRVVDVSDPANPLQVGVYDSTGHSFYHVAAVGNYAYVTDEAGLMTIDASDPSNPAVVGYCPTGSGGTGQVGQVAVTGSYAFVAGTDSDLTVVDISNPANPHAVAFHRDTTGGGQGTKIVVSGAYAYALHGVALVVIDVSNPLNPVTVGSVPVQPTWTGNPLAVAGNYAYVGTVVGPVPPWFPVTEVLDIADPQSPQMVGYYPDQDIMVYGAAAAGDLLYLAESNAGLQIIQFQGIGIEESETRPTTLRSPLTATVVRGVLQLGAGSRPKAGGRAELLDISGRETMELRPGANDVGRLPPGVYFVMEERARSRKQSASSIKKIVLTD